MKYEYNISPEEFEQIERFLNNEMSNDEAASFSKTLQEDVMLQRKLSEVKMLSLGISETALRQSLDSYHAGIQREQGLKKSGKLIPFGKVFLAAASVLLVSLIGWWLFFKGSKSDQLYSSYYKPDPGLMTVMGASDNYVFEKAMVEYKNGNYKKAIEGWSALLETQPANDTLNYFLGEAYQAEKKYDKAIFYLHKATAHSNSSFYQDACWYLGLIYFKNGDSEKAKEFLQKSGRSESQQLLEVLQSN